MARFKDVNWELVKLQNGSIQSWEQAQLAVLMDIRDEMKALNKTLAFYRVQNMADAMIRAERRMAKHWPLRDVKRNG